MQTKTGAFLIVAIFAVFLSCRHIEVAGNDDTQFARQFADAAELAGQDISGEQAAGAAGAAGRNIAGAVNAPPQEVIRNAAEEMTPEQKYFIGRAVAANILARYRIWNGDPALTAYLNKICMAITVNSPGPDLFNGYRVAILDTGGIKSFATPGGHIFLSKGLVSAALSEDALAGLIAHEIAHIQLQHGIRAVTGIRITEINAGSCPDEFSGIFGKAVGEIVNTLNKGYSQAQEFEADNLALSLLASAGYSPLGLLEVLKELENIRSAHPEDFCSIHPSPARRIANIQRYIGNFTVTDTRSYRQERFNMMMRNLQ